MLACGMYSEQSPKCRLLWTSWGTSWVWCLSQASDHQQFLLAGKPFCYVIFACYRMISYDQSEIGLWTGSLVGKRARTSGETGRGLHSTRSACWFIFSLFPTAEPVYRLSWNSQAKLSRSHHQMITIYWIMMTPGFKPFTVALCYTQWNTCCPIQHTFLTSFTRITELLWLGLSIIMNPYI